MIEILSRKVIKPSIPTPLHLRNYKISFIDQLASPIHFGMIFFFFTSDQDTTKSANENANKCNQLEESLSETLARFYPLAGRFSKDNFTVDCNDQGVEVARAKVHLPLAEILCKRPQTELLDTFVPDPIALARLVPWPVLAIQINMFDCGGIALGIQILHNIGDGVSLLTFLNQWANTNHKGGLHQVIDSHPSFELASLFPARKLVGLKPDPQALPNKLVTKCFLFESHTISAWKRERKSIGRLPSKVQVVTAHIWRTRIQIARVKHGHSRPSLVSFAMSLRGRTPKMVIPKNSYGTLVGHTTALFTADDQDKVELGDLVSLLGDAIRKTGEDFAKARNEEDIYWMLIKYYNEIGGDKPSGVDLCRFTSWCGFSCYGINFGWGEPSWVATVSKGVELVFLLDTKCGDAIEAWVTLNEEDMIEFERYYKDHCKSSAVNLCSSKL